MKKIRTFVFLPHVTWMLSSWECFASLYVFVATWVSLCFSEEPQVGWLTLLKCGLRRTKFSSTSICCLTLCLAGISQLFCEWFSLSSHHALILSLETKQKQTHVVLLPLVRCEQLSDYDIAAKKIRIWFTSLQCLQAIINLLGLISLRSYSYVD